MTRNGKIARLPAVVREKINQRLYDGEEGETILAWLNGDRRVRWHLAQSFGGAPVSKQNLSEWRQGGYLEWLREEETRHLVYELHGRQATQKMLINGEAVSDLMAGMLAGELLRSAQAMLAATETAEPEARWKQLEKMFGMLDNLRKRDHRAMKVNIEREKWREEQRQARVKKAEQEMDERVAEAMQPKWEALKEMLRAAGKGEQQRREDTKAEDNQTLRLGDKEMGKVQGPGPQVPTAEPNVGAKDENNGRNGIYRSDELREGAAVVDAGVTESESVKASQTEKGTEGEGDVGQMKNRTDQTERTDRTDGREVLREGAAVEAAGTAGSESESVKVSQTEKESAGEDNQTLRPGDREMGDGRPTGEILEGNLGNVWPERAQQEAEIREQMEREQGGSS